MAIDRHETASLFGGTALSAALHVAALTALLGLGTGIEIPAEPLSMVVEIVVSTQPDADAGTTQGQQAEKSPSEDTGNIPEPKAATPPDVHPTAQAETIAEPPKASENKEPPVTPQTVQTIAPPPPPKPVHAATNSSPAPKPAHTATAPTPPRAKRTSSPAAVTAEPAPAADAPDTQIVLPTQQASIDRPGAAPATAPATAEPRAGDGMATGSQASAAALVANPAPSYPPIARRRGLEGKVVLRVAVTSAGTAGDISVLSSSGHTMLDDAAARAVRAWRFRPAQRNGAAIDSVLEVPIVFRLVTGDAPMTTSRAGATE